MKALKDKDKKNALAMHTLLDHPGQEGQFRMTVIGQPRGAFTRQQQEGIEMRYSKAKNTINSKTDFHQPSMVRLAVVDGNSQEEQRSSQDVVSGVSCYRGGAARRSRGRTGRTRGA